MCLTILPEPIRSFYDELWNRVDRSRIDEILAPDVTFRGSLGDRRVGYEPFWSYVVEVTSALSDYRCRALACVRDEDRVFARMRFEGLHTAPFRGFAPTGRPVAWEGAALFQLRDRRIGDVWVLGDLQGLDALLTAQAESARGTD